MNVVVRFAYEGVFLRPSLFLALFIILVTKRSDDCYFVVFAFISLFFFYETLPTIKISVYM